MLLAPPWGSLLGEQAGNFTFVEELGAGSMGVVLRAIHPVLAREAAVKVLRANCATDDNSRARFLREAQLVNRIVSPRIPRVTDAGILADGRPWIAMDLVQGPTLSTMLAGSPRPPLETSVAIASDLLDVVTAAHALGIVHRDLKPENIVLSPKGVVVLDFGVAKLLDESNDAGLTSTGGRLGTPAYMAPEQIAGRPVDARTDVYAASVVLYEMLAGERPFGGSDFEILSGHLEGTAPPLRPRFPDISPELESIVNAGLSKDPQRRFQSTRAMRTALGNAQKK